MTHLQLVQACATRPPPHQATPTSTLRLPHHDNHPSTFPSYHQPSTLRSFSRNCPLPTMASPPPVEDQARLLEDALGVVRQQTMLMRRCLETPGKLMDALKCRYDFNMLFHCIPRMLSPYVHQLDISIRTAYEQPWSQAVLRAVYGRIRRPTSPRCLSP